MTDIISSDRPETLKFGNCILLSQIKVTYFNDLIIICVMNTLQL